MGLFSLPPSHLVEIFLARAYRAASATRGAERLYILPVLFCSAPHPLDCRYLLLLLHPVWFSNIRIYFTKNGKTSEVSTAD